MTGSDLIVEAPWIIFGAAVLAICLRDPLRARPARRQPEAGSAVFLRPGRRLPGGEPRTGSAAGAVIVPAAPRRQTNQAA